MKKIALMLLVLTCSLAASAQQSIVSKRLDAFRNIDLSGNLHVELIKADSAHIEIVANTGGAVYYQGEPEIFRSATKMMGTVNNIGK